MDTHIQNWSQLTPNENDTTPLYVQLANALASAIDAAWWQAGELFPSERVLSENVKVSRDTARRAMVRLLEQGVVSRKERFGTYVRSPEQQAWSRLLSFSEQVTVRGFTPSSRFLARGLFEPNQEEIIKLALPEKTKVARLKRLRLADQTVMALEMTSLPAAILPAPEKITDSLYAYLQTKGHTVVRALQRARAVKASSDIASLIGVKTGEPMLLMTRLGYDEKDHPIELAVSYCRNDYYDFVSELRR